MKKIKNTISRNSSKKIFFNEDYTYSKTSEGFIYRDKLGQINLPLPNLTGDFQISNVTTAIATVRNLNQFEITESHIKKAITKIKSEGRLQNIKKGKLRRYVSKNNQILVDGAHNPLAALAVKKHLENLNLGKKIFMILGMMANKEHKKFIEIFKNKVQEIITLDIPNQSDFIDKEKLSKIVISCGIPSKKSNSIESALKSISKKDSDAIIFCTGSLYLAGEILNLN